jgi:hypothetical protein
LARTFCAALLVCLAAIMATQTSAAAVPLVPAHTHSIRAGAASGQPPVVTAASAVNPVPSDPTAREPLDMGLFAFSPLVVGALGVGLLFILIGRRRR